MGQEIAAFWVELLVGPWARVKALIEQVKSAISIMRIKD